MNERQITPVTHQSNVPVGINFFDPTTIETLNRFSTMFANSSLVPESYRIGGVVGGKTGEGPKKTVSEAEAVANCVIAFDVATRIGASPLMVMQNLYIVYGRPSWSSKFLIATINTCGRFEPLKFELTSNGVCNNGVANVKCVAWTTPKGVTFPYLYHGTASNSDQRTGFEASQLVDGSEDYHRFCFHDEQGV